MIFHIRKQELPAWEFLKSCADLIAESLVSVVGVFKEDQTAVRRKAAFSGEVERVSEVIEQVLPAEFMLLNDMKTTVLFVCEISFHAG